MTLLYGFRIKSRNAKIHAEPSTARTYVSTMPMHRLTKFTGGSPFRSGARTRGEARLVLNYTHIRLK